MIQWNERRGKDKEGMAEQNQNQDMQKPHKRRVRYKGTHPRTFEEKYKEREPEKYAETIEKVISKGSTPAGMHLSICVDEILEFLQIQPGQRGLDATLGYGGHSRRMLEKLEGSGHLYGLDVDPIEIVKTETRIREKGYGADIFTVRKMNFADVLELSREVGKFDFILADLGVSSMQIDNPERGFTYKAEGPLDLRLDPEKGVSAAEMFRENSDEPYAEEIAAAVFKRNRKKDFIKTTIQMKETIEDALSFLPEQERKEAAAKSCRRCFQALRIDVNSEFEVLDRFLGSLPDILAPGGRAAILTFHSGEDRLVKHYFKEGKKDGLYQEISGDVIRPSAEECQRNPRARSTKMRWAVRA